MEMSIEFVQVPRQQQLGQTALRKIENAEKLLHTLKTDWESSKNKVSVTYEPVAHPPNRTIDFIAHLENPSDFEQLEALARACVSELRSSLDNVVFDLGRQSNASKNSRDHNAFPIVDDSSQWKKQGVSKLKEIPKEITRRICDVQPFAAPIPSGSSHPLTLLRDLSNEDKHRESFFIGLTSDFPIGVHQFGEITLEMSPAASARFRSELEANGGFGIILKNPVLNGEVAYRHTFTGDVGLESLKSAKADIPLTLALFHDSDQEKKDLLYLLDRTLHYTRATVRYIAGLTPLPPVVIHEQAKSPQRIASSAFQSTHV